MKVDTQISILFLSTPLFLYYFFFNDTATTEIYTLSLHDALPIFGPNQAKPPVGAGESGDGVQAQPGELGQAVGRHAPRLQQLDRKSTRLNSSHSQISYAVFCLKKKKNKHTSQQQTLLHQSSSLTR